MIKKAVSALLTLLLILCLPAAVYARDEEIVIAVCIKSDIGGKSQENTDAFFEILSGGIVPGKNPVSVSDYAGIPCSGKPVAGRKYNIDYTFTAAPGRALPEELTDENFRLECGGGVKVYSKNIVVAPIRDESGEFNEYRAIRVCAVVTADGGIFERIAGFIYDLFLKIRTFQLY